MERIVIIGCPGGGKTTFARALGAKLAIPVHHLDQHFWKPDWAPTPEEEFLNIQNDLMKEPSWILDGNFKKSIANRIVMADTVVLFDFPRVVNLWRTLKRFFNHFGKVRPDMGGDNKEALKWKHLKYIASFPREEFYKQVVSLAGDKKVIVFNNSREVSDFLKAI